MTAGREATPRDAASTERLQRYWAEGPGAAKIQWGVPGDFDRCIVEIQKAVTDGGQKPLPDGVIKGLCSNLHARATGFRPGHAPTEQAAHHKG
jgi:hypothetical protein